MRKTTYDPNPDRYRYSLYYKEKDNAIKPYAVYMISKPTKLRFSHKNRASLFDQKNDDR